MKTLTIDLMATWRPPEIGWQDGAGARFGFIRTPGSHSEDVERVLNVARQLQLGDRFEVNLVGSVDDS